MQQCASLSIVHLPWSIIKLFLLVQKKHFRIGVFGTIRILLLSGEAKKLTTISTSTRLLTDTRLYMTKINRQKIDDYFSGEFSPEGEKYLGNVFNDESNTEELNKILQEQWKSISEKKLDPHLLDHLLYKINYQINSSEEQPINRPIVKLLNWYARIAAVLLIPLLVLVGFVTFKQTQNVEATGWAEVSAPYGAKLKFSLPDGTNGWLNSGSTIKYALNFNQKREVCLIGQAFFEVKHNDDNKFIVKTRYFDIEDVGTAFDVAAYGDEELIDVTLEQGSAIIKSADLKTPIEINPNEQISYSTVQKTFKKNIVVAQNFSAWKEGRLILRNASLEELAKQLSRWYNIDVEIQNSLHADLRYRATFTNENLNEVLQLLKISSPIDFTVVERTVQADGSFSKQKITLIVDHV